MIINAQNLSIIYQAFKTAFNVGFRNAEAGANWGRIATLVPSTTKEEKYGWLGQFPRLREWVGDRYVKNLALHDYSIKNKKYESTIGVPADDLRDDTYGVFKPLFEEMGFAAMTHPDELVYALLAAGFTETCYDGQPFFDADHPVAEVSVSNYQSGGSAPWFLLDTRRPLKPLILQRRADYDFKAMTKDDDEKVFMRDEFRYGIDGRLNVGFGFWQLAYASKAALDQDNYDAAVAAMMAFKSDEGRPLGVRPNLLVTGAANRAAAKAVIEVQRLSSGADNPNYKDVEVFIAPWLS